MKKSDHLFGAQNQWSLTPLILNPLILVLVLLLAAIHPAAAVTTTASNGLSCAGTRSTTNLGCNAGEFTTIVNITNAPGALTSCVAGEYVTYHGTVSLSGTNADRYDIGFFTGENGNDPALNNASNLCSVATFPTSPLPWFAKDADACGDYTAAGVDTAIINNINVLCAGDATGALMIPYTLVYSQNAGIVCAGPTNVVAVSTSKCNKGIAVVPVDTFTVNGSVTVTKQTVPDGDTQSFAFTAIGTGPVMSGDDSFPLTDNVSKQVRMGISGTNQILTITEEATALWESTAIITCTKPDGSSSAGFVTTDGATRTITATLSNTNPNALCTITNKRAVSAMNSTVVADPTSVLSDGVSTSTITVTLKDTSVAGNPVAGKTVTLTAGSGSSTITTVSGVTDANGQAIFTVKNTVAEAVTYTATDTTDGITIAQTATVTFFSVSSFNAFETSTVANAIIGNIYTKLAGTAFGLDVVAIAAGSQATGFSGNVKVELLANTGTVGSGYGADNCPTSNSVIQTIASTAIAGGRSTVNFAAVADAYRDVRMRISYPTSSPTVTTCSNDSFAIRPNSLVVSTTDTDWQTAGTARTLANTGASGGNVHKAGQPFTVTATAKNTSNITTANYAGTPALTVSNCSPAGTACTASLGTFALGMATGFASGVLTSNLATYSEVGAFDLMLQDTDFAWVDAGDTPATCAGYYVCGTTSVGRFVPDHFDTVVELTATLPMPCPTGLTCPASYDGFAYSGQLFSLKVTAMNASGNTTVNYNTTTGLAKTTNLTAWGELGTTTVPTGTGALGVASVAAFAAGTLTEAAESYTFTAVPTAPTDIYMRAVDEDGVTSLRTTNPTTTSVEGGVKIVSGRIKISNAHGSELLPLPMTATVQYYNGTYWTTSITDDVTSFDTTLSTSGGNLVATIISGLGDGITVSNPGTNTVVDGVRTFRFAAPSERGSANISLNAPAYLLSNTARATFGVYKGNNEFIYIRENY